MNKKGNQAAKTANASTNNFLQPANVPPPLTASFADVTKQHKQHKPSGSYGTWNATNESDLFTFAEISEIMLSCVNELAKCTSKIEQLKVVAKMLNHAFK